MVTVLDISPVRMFVRILLDNGDVYWLRKNDLQECSFEEGYQYELNEFISQIRLCQYPRALNHAVSLLARRPYSKKELLTRLLHLKYTEEVSDLVIYKLEKEHLIDDQAFCEQWVRFRRERKLGPSLIRRELKLKGISDDTIQKFLDETDSEAESDNAVTLAKKAWKRIHAEEDIRRSRQKIAAFLVRKGYSWDIAYSACKKAEKDK